MPALLDQLTAAARRIETPFDPADGPGHLVWHAWGEGPPVVLLHGGAGSWRHWVRNIPALARTRTVLAADLPGLGESSAPPMPYTPARVASLVAAGMRQAMPPGASCDLVGFSFGAMAASHVAANHPGLMHSLTIIGAGGLGVPRAPIRLDSVRDKVGIDREEANFTNLHRLMIADPARIDALALAIQDWNARHVRVSSVPFAGSTLLLDALRAVRCPIGAIWGELDQIARDNLPARIAALRTVRPDIPVEIIPGAGHWVSYEAADAFDAALARLLAGYA